MKQKINNYIVYSNWGMFVKEFHRLGKFNCAVDYHIKQLPKVGYLIIVEFANNRKVRFEHVDLSYLGSIMDLIDNNKLRYGNTNEK